jgi:hypothetical protein
MYISKFIPKCHQKIALTNDFILCKKALTEVVKTLLNGHIGLQNAYRINTGKKQK